MIYFGWDISTANIGMCAVDDKQNVVAIDVLRLSKESKNINEKFVIAAKGVREFIKSVRNKFPNEIERHSIEERLKSCGRVTNKNTLLSLASINAVVTHVIIEECAANYLSVVHLHPNEVKKLMNIKVAKGEDKKKITVDIVRSLYPEFPFKLNKKGVNPVEGTEDMADAYVTAVALLRKDIEQNKKRISANKGAGKTSVKE